VISTNWSSIEAIDTLQLLPQSTSKMASKLVENSLVRSGFHYRPLDDPYSIRLVRLHPAWSRVGEVQVDLDHTTLMKCADIYNHYIALSYV
jgi:hypothetical protein